MTDLQPREDSSLQHWGRHLLPKIAPAIQEAAAERSKNTENARNTTAAIKKIAQMANDGTLPADRRLAAEVDAVAKAHERLDAEQEALDARRRALAAQAEALPAMYRREHETDEDRVNAPRVSRAAEKRADVGYAEQDT